MQPNEGLPGLCFSDVMSATVLRVVTPKARNPLQSLKKLRQARGRPEAMQVREEV
jgi:hypothetical protein